MNAVRRPAADDAQAAFSAVATRRAEARADRLLPGPRHRLPRRLLLDRVRIRRGDAAGERGLAEVARRRGIWICSPASRTPWTMPPRNGLLAHELVPASIFIDPRVGPLLGDFGSAREAFGNPPFERGGRDRRSCRQRWPPLGRPGARSGVYAAGALLLLASLRRTAEARARHSLAPRPPGGHQPRARASDGARLTRALPHRGRALRERPARLAGASSAAAEEEQPATGSSGRSPPPSRPRPSRRPRPSAGTLSLDRDRPRRSIAARAAAATTSSGRRPSRAPYGRLRVGTRGRSRCPRRLRRNSSSARQDAPAGGAGSELVGDGVSITLPRGWSAGVPRGDSVALSAYPSQRLVLGAVTCS